LPGKRESIAFDRAVVPVYDGVVLKVISAPELARNLDPILKALEETGTTLIIKNHDQPAALLVRFDAYVAMLATMDYSGWERWIEEVRSAFPTSVFSPPRRPKSLVPASIDPADIGYAPQFGQVGTPAGRRRLGEELATMGIQLEEQQLGRVYSLVLSLAERKRALYAEDLKLAVDEALGRATPGRYSLQEVQVNAQSGLSSTAEVSLTDDGVLKTGSATGNGTLDAVFRAIQQLTGVPAELEDFSLAAATQGSDAQGEAVVTLSQGSQVVVGRALALDVIEAAAKAYVNALNWLVRPQQDMAPSLTIPRGGRER
jgi:LeuA-like protein with dimerisation domain